MSLDANQLYKAIPYRDAYDLAALITNISPAEVERISPARENGGVIPPTAQFAVACEVLTKRNKLPKETAREIAAEMAIELLTGKAHTLGYDKQTVVPAHVRDTIDAVVADIRTVALSRANKPYEPEHYIDTKIVPAIETHPDKDGNYEATIVMYGKQIGAWIGHASPQKYGNAYFTIKTQMQKLLDKMRESYKTREIHQKVAKKHAENEKKKQGKLF